MRTNWKFDADAWASSLKVCTSSWNYRHPDARSRNQALLVRAQREVRRLNSLLTRHADKHDSVDLLAPIGQAKEFAAHVAQLLTANAQTALNPERGGTPETLSKPGRVDPLERLVEQRVLLPEHLRAGRSIEELVHQVTAGSHARAGQLMQGRSPGTSTMPAQIAERWSLTYLPWCAEQQRLEVFGQRHLAVTLDIVVWRRGVREAAARWRLGRLKAHRILREALTDWHNLNLADHREKWDQRFMQMLAARQVRDVQWHGTHT